MSDFDPRDLIDRKAEQELFGDLVSFRTPARMLIICDNGGRGKSSLLKRLEYNCRHEIKPRVPACLIELQDVKPSAFELIDHIVKGLNIVDRFARFKELNEARKLKDFRVFTQGDASKTRYPGMSPQITAAVRIEGSIEKDAKVAAISAHRANIHFAQAPEFTAEQEELAQQRCIEAFFEDLRAITAIQPVVIIFDTWEKCDLGMRDWIQDELFGSRCFHRDRNLRPDKLAIVVAGRPHKVNETPYGLRLDEFRHLFEDVADYESSVSSVKSLSDWDAEHVRDFLVQNGYPAPTELEIAFMQSQLKKGIPFTNIFVILSAISFKRAGNQ